MAHPQQPEQHDQYRIVLVLPWSKKVLVERDSNGLRLPHVNIPKWTRPAEQLTKSIHEKWGLSSIVIDFLPQEQDMLACAVIEVRTSDWKFALDGLASVGLDELDEQELRATERGMVRSILSGGTQGRGPFSRLGWIEEAQEWIRASAHNYAVEFNGEVRQLNASANFALIRVGTKQGPGFWLKATGPPNLHEFKITIALSKYFPSYLPPLVASREDWNAWVTEHAGLSLRECFSEATCRWAVLSLAELQRASSNQADTLLRAGCRDSSIALLSAHVGEMIEYLSEAMERQTSTKVPRLGRKRLMEIRDLLNDSCSEMLSLNIPNTLVHNDINPGNILLQGERCVFTDWAEAAVGHPFLIFEYLCVHIGQHGEEARSWLPQLKMVYKQLWQEQLSEAAIETALGLSPLLAVAASLYGRGDWLHPVDLHSLASQSYRRSLGRHMDLAAHALEQARPSC
jgi:hypothetical protein